MAERTVVPWLGRLDPDARKVDLHDQPSDGETESQAAFAARLWRTARAPRIEFEGALFKGGSNYGESEFFGLSSSAPNRSIQTKVGSTFRLFYNLSKFALGLVFRSA
jgi:hypothetical protein